MSFSEIKRILVFRAQLAMVFEKWKKSTVFRCVKITESGIFSRQKCLLTVESSFILLTFSAFVDFLNLEPWIAFYLVDLNFMQPVNASSKEAINSPLIYVLMEIWRQYYENSLTGGVSL